MAKAVKSLVLATSNLSVSNQVENSSSKDLSAEVAAASCKESNSNLTQLVCGFKSLTMKKKDDLLLSYQNRFKSSTSKSLVSSSQGERISSYKNNLPSNTRLVRDCKMKPSLDVQYRVDDLSLCDVAVSIVKRWALYFGSNHGL